MKTEKELADAITKLTMTIKDRSPELSKYLEEMPVTIPNENHPDINRAELQKYYDSLCELLKKYDEGHNH